MAGITRSDSFVSFLRAVSTIHRRRKSLTDGYDFQLSSNGYHFQFPSNGYHFQLSSNGHHFQLSFCFICSFQLSIFQILNFKITEKVLLPTIRCYRVVLWVPQHSSVILCIVIRNIDSWKEQIRQKELKFIAIRQRRMVESSLYQILL